MAVHSTQHIMYIYTHAHIQLCGISYVAIAAPNSPLKVRRRRQDAGTLNVRTLFQLLHALRCVCVRTHFVSVAVVVVVVCRASVEDVRMLMVCNMH